MLPCGTRARRTDSSPSLISISARLDSSSRSISFLILRRSMAFLLVRKRECWSKARSAIREPGDGRVQCVAVAVGAEAGDHADGEIAEVAGAAERLAGVRVRQVDLDEGDGDRGERVAQRD